MLSNMATRIFVTVLSALILGALALVWQWVREIREAVPTSAVPNGAVVAFDVAEGCPKGWIEFTEAKGLVIIGAGDKYRYRTFGGQDEIIVTNEHIPRHTHEYLDVYHAEDDKRRPEATIQVDVPGTLGAGIKPDRGNVGWANTRETEPSGSDDNSWITHTNMQPFIALHFCKPD